MTGATTRLRSRTLAATASGTLVELTRQEAGWNYVGFAVRQIADGDTFTAETAGDELCLVLLEGECRVRWSADGGDEGARGDAGDRGAAGHRDEDGQSGARGHVGEARLGPRADVFSSYPHALYLPPGTAFVVEAAARTQLAEGRAPATARHEPRVITPADCGFEIRGGGNATRQIVDIMPPAFPAERLLVCEVFTPSGNWSSYPPHKHDTDNPPAEVALEETYYYRFRERDAYGIQRLYEGNDCDDEALTVRDGDLVLIRRGYHPFVSAYGYDAYYLNVLAGTHRSMAASDDPRYAAFRARWPAADARAPLVCPPFGDRRSEI